MAGLEDAIVAAATKKLDAAVTAGKLTAAQEATMLADLKSHVDDMVNRTGPPPGGPAARPPRPAARRSGRQLERQHRRPRPTARSSASESGRALEGRTRAEVPTRHGPTLRPPRRVHVANDTDLPASGAFGYLRCQRRSRCSSSFPASMPTVLARSKAGARGRFPASAERRSSWLFPFATHEGATRNAQRPIEPMT